jgi:hypothetical protein
MLHHDFGYGGVSGEETDGSGCGYGLGKQALAICLPSELNSCGKLLKARRGEVAERLNAAVC